MNKRSKLATFFVAMGLMLVAFQSSVSAGGHCERKFRKSSFSLNFNLGLGTLFPSACEYDYVERRYPVYERRVVRECYPRVRERVVVYSAPEYYEEVVVRSPRYRERVIVCPPSPVWW
jgi:hypothetical protein